MSDDSDDKPYTHAELSESELGTMALPDQVRYAIYNEHYYLSEIVDIVTFSGEWTTEIIEDMVDDGDLLEGDDPTGVFYMLPDDENDRGLTTDERDAVHAEALTEYRSEATIGDEDDVTATMSMERDDGETAEAEVEDVDMTHDADGEPPSEPAADADTTTVDAHGKASASATPASADSPGAMAAPDDDDTVVGERPSPAEIKKARAEHGGRLPVDRDYDWGQFTLEPDRVDDYISADGEYEDIVKEIEDRRDTGKLAHFRVVGPTGCGKTSLGENIAEGMDAVCFTINCHEGLRPNNLLGMPTYVGDETWWVDGPLTKALLASRDRPVVVIFDEVNRTTARTLGVIMSALDHRAEVTLNARGGEKVQGDPMNLIVFSTMNQGDGYVTNQIDRAQLRRLGNTIPTDYIGMHDVDAEAALIADRTPVSKEVAREMVEAANDIRRKADGDSAISMGIPTSTMLDWARTAWSYRDDDVDGGPLIKAGHRAVLNTFFRGDESEEDIVTTTLESHLRGMEIDEDLSTDDDDGDDDTEADDEAIDLSDETWLMCESCGWYDEVGAADDEVVTLMECPECGDDVVPKEAT